MRIDPADCLRVMSLVCALLASVSVALPIAAAAGKVGEGGRAMPARVSSNLAPVMAADRPGARIAGASIDSEPAADTPIRLDVVLDDPPADARGRLRDMGARVMALSHRFHRASVRVRGTAAIESIAGLSWVRYVYPEYGAVRAAGSVDSRAPEALSTEPLVDGTLAALSGAGERVGIISDSFARRPVGGSPPGIRDSDTQPAECNRKPAELTGSAAQDSADLPAAVELRADDAFFLGDDGDPATDDCPDTTGGTTLRDEGAAMAELVHDLAPDAAISFHTGFNGFAAFATAIEDLCKVPPAGAGASVVVDDLQYFAELMYQPDIVSQAVRECVNGGTAYFAAAGNGGGAAIRSNFRDFRELDDDGRNDGALFPLNDRDFHDWGRLDPYLRIDVPAGAGFSAVLQWNQPALSVPQNERDGPRVDLDLFVLDDASVFASQVAGQQSVSAQDQQAARADAGADPVEIVQITNSGSSARSYYLVLDHWAGAQETIPQEPGTPLEFRLVFFKSGAGVRVEGIDTAPNGRGPTLYGHALADGAVSVGAVPWFEAAPAFDATENGTATIDPEPFTAVGGTLQRQFRDDGSFRIDSTAIKPDLAAVDGNNTTFFGRDIDGATIQDGEPDGDPNFFGTSAAAPNAAAVAALLREHEPSMTPAELTNRMKTGARDVTGTGATPGCDAVTGAGLIDAAAADSARNQAPSAEAGPDQSVAGGEAVTLDASESMDDQAIAAYYWSQVRGPRAGLDDPASPRPAFSAPNVDTTLVFELRVHDDACLADFDRIGVDVSATDDDDGGGGAIHAGALLLALWACVRNASRRVPNGRHGLGRARLPRPRSIGVKAVRRAIGPSVRRLFVLPT